MMAQTIVWSVSLLLMAIVAAIFAWVADGASRKTEDYGALAAAAYRLRPWLFLILAVAMVGASWYTLGRLPYHALARERADVGPVQRVSAIGELWAWKITPNRLMAGQPVDFHVTSKDVNHGFAIYDPSLRIVAQTQAMPGFDNVLRHTFDEPGTYRVMCLEYCGLMHHEMKAEITVLPRE